MAVIQGTNGDDLLNGTGGDDQLLGFAGVAWHLTGFFLTLCGDEAD